MSSHTFGFISSLHIESTIVVLSTFGSPKRHFLPTSMNLFGSIDAQPRATEHTSTAKSKPSLIGLNLPHDGYACAAAATQSHV